MSIWSRSRRSARSRETSDLTDDVTGLPNYLAVQRWLDRHAGKPVAVGVLDLHRFMFLNDRFGHEVGNRVLNEVGAALGAAVDGDVFVARMPGDRFAVLTTAPERAERVEAAMRIAMREVTTPDGAPVEACVGVVVGPAAWQLVHDADRPLYAEKRARAQQRAARRTGP